MSNELADAETLAKATAGDSSALERLLLAHCPALSRYIAKRIPTSLQSVLSVDDVLQQTLLQAFRNIRRFRPKTPQSFWVWLRTIAENQLNNTTTSLTRQKRGGGYRNLVARPAPDRSGSFLDLVEMLSDGRGTPSQSAMRREAVDVIRVAIARLPTDQREAVELRFLEGKSLQETAATMGKTTSAVRSLIHRAKKVMKDRLGRSSRWFLAE